MSQGGVTPLDYNPHAAQQGGVTPTIYPGGGPAANDPGGTPYARQQEGYGPFLFRKTDQTPVVIFDKLFSVPRGLSMIRYVIMIRDQGVDGWINIYMPVTQVVAYKSGVWNSNNSLVGIGAEAYSDISLSIDQENLSFTVDADGYVSATMTGGPSNTSNITGFEIVDPGQGYQKDDTLAFVGGDATNAAHAWVIAVDGNGGITQANYSPGVYNSIPEVFTTTATHYDNPAPGTGAKFRATGFAGLKLTYVLWILDVHRCPI